MVILCFSIYSRFESTVVAQFHGHTHDDWFLVINIMMMMILITVIMMEDDEDDEGG